MFVFDFENKLTCISLAIVHAIPRAVGKYETCVLARTPGRVYCLTDTFHVAVRLFSDRSQMTSKCGKKKTSGTRAADVFYHILTSSVIYH